MEDKLVPRADGGLVHSVVVLNYKGREDTLECLSGLLAPAKGVRDVIHVMLVDNGSNDNVISDATRIWPNISSVQLPENLGFAGGMNVGLTRLLAGAADTITVLNNDTQVDGLTIAQLGRLALERSAAVSPTINYVSAPNEPWFAGGVLDVETFQPRHMSRAEVAMHDRTMPDEDQIRFVDVLAGCCITAPSNVWRTVGIFDERYFLNFEDSDWSLRAQKHGVPLLVAKNMVIWHKVSASFKGEYSFLGHYYYVRNGLLFRKSRPTSRAASAKFLRSNVLPAVVRAARDGKATDGLRLATLTCGALLHHGLGRYGKAPRWAHAVSRTRKGERVAETQQ